MATPGELVHIIANALGIPQATVVQYDRNLAAVGLRTKGGRGRSAAQVTSRDAANLLIAIGGAPISGASVKETRTTCDLYRTLRTFESGTSTSNFSRFKSQLPTLARLPREHSFGDAIAALINSFAAGEFRSLERPDVRVGFYGPIPQGIIVVEIPERRVQLSYRKSRGWASAKHDLRQQRYFGLVTLTKVAKIVGHKEVTSIDGTPRI